MSINLSEILSLEDLNEIKKDFELEIIGLERKGQKIEIELSLTLKPIKKGEKEIYFYDSNFLFERIEAYLISDSTKNKVELIDSLKLVEIEEEKTSKNIKI